MIVALFALAAAMLVAGVTAVIEGFPYVRLESGMALVYGGSVVASSGILLGGLGVVALWLRRVEKALREGTAFGTIAAAVSASSNTDVFAEPDLTVPSYVPPVMGLVPERSRVEPSLDMPHEPHAEHASAEPQLPMPGLDAFASPAVDSVKTEAPKPDESKPAEPNDDLFVPGRSESASVETTTLRSSLDAAPEPSVESKPERTVVGRYSSGGNTYMMYDNGTIEAETPNGRFTFASLDELKAFVDSGGEGGARGAA